MNKVFFVIDIETDGPIPGDYSMLELGAVALDETGKQIEQYRMNLAPISDKYEQQRLDLLKTTRRATEFAEPADRMITQFIEWVKKVKGDKKAVFVSDNNGFDWMFVCWYLHHFAGENPFGYKSLSLSSLYKGLNKSLQASLPEIVNKEHDALLDAIHNAKILSDILRDISL